MPSTVPLFKEIKRLCDECGQPLVIRNSRDILRRKYCSHSCKGEVAARKLAARPKVFPGKCIKCGVSFIGKSKKQRFCGTKCQSLATYYRLAKTNTFERQIRRLIKFRKGRRSLEVEGVIELYHKQNGKCALTGRTLTFIHGDGRKAARDNISIDRIDISKGYTLDNVQLVCFIVNKMRNNLTVPEFIEYSKQVASYVPVI